MDARPEASAGCAEFHLPCFRLRPEFHPVYASGDLKSDNIFVNGSAGIVKIGDLGFATLRGGMSVVMSVIGEEGEAPVLPVGRGVNMVDEVEDA